MGRRAAFPDVGLDGGGAHSSREREVDGGGAVCSGTGAVRTEHATPFSTLAGDSPHRGRAAVWAVARPSVARVGQAHLIAGPGYLAVVESVWPGPAFRRVSRSGGPDRVGGHGTWEPEWDAGGV